MAKFFDCWMMIMEIFGFVTTTFSVLLYECGSWYHALRGEHTNRLKISEKRSVEENFWT
jgi:hypothetical protein